jgi:hypothetical protein
MRQVIVLAGLLGLALVGSYLSWTREDESANREGVPLYRAAEGEIDKIVFTTKSREVVVEKRADASGSYAWISTTEEVEVKPPAPPDTDTDTDVTPAPEPVKETKKDAFAGSDAADELLGKYAPLVAIRKLEVSADRYAEFGLDAEKAEKLEITRKGETITLVVGGETYGAKDRYVQKDGVVYLVDKDAIRSLELARTKLKQRQLVAVNEADARRVVVKLPTALELVHQNPADAEKRYWAAGATPDKENAPAKGWVTKLARLRVLEYADPAAVAGAKPVLAYAVTGEDGTWTVEIAEAADGATYAVSSLTHAPVKVDASSVKDLLSDLEAVAGDPGAEPPGESPEPEPGPEPGGE